MSWDFETEPEFQLHLDWMKEFIREEIRPLDMILGNPYDKADRKSQAIAAPLKEKVKERGLWACHLDEDLGGMGFGQLKLALMNDLLGVSRWGPSIFGCQAPDSGNAEILAGFGTEQQKTRYLKPLLDGEISSCYSMTEPHAGSDPKMFRTSAVRDGDDWVINGEKFYISGAGDPRCKIMITMVKTSPDAPPHRQQSQILVPMDTPGVNILGPMHVFGHDDAPHGHMHIMLEDVRVPKENILLGEGRGFEISQVRLGPGRIHHCMRLIGVAERSLEAICARAKERVAFGKPLAEQGVVMDIIARSRIEIEQARLMTLKAADMMDKLGNKAARAEIAMIKVVAPNMALAGIDRAVQVEGGGCVA